MVVFNYQWRSQPKICILRGKNFGGPKCLILGEQQYFVWDTASQSTKLLYVLNIWGVWPPRSPWLRLWTRCANIWGGMAPCTGYAYASYEFKDKRASLVACIFTAGLCNTWSDCARLLKKILTKPFIQVFITVLLFYHLPPQLLVLASNLKW